MNKVEVGLTIAVVGILFYVGALVYYEMAVELEANPDIKDIGGPPVITDLRLLAGVVGIAALFCAIVLKMHPKEVLDEEMD